MTFLLFIEYACMVTIFLFFMKWLTDHGRIVALFALPYFFLTTLIRPAVLLFGLDTPSPDYLFANDEMDLTGQALLAVSVWLVVFIVAYIALESVFLKPAAGRGTGNPLVSDKTPSFRRILALAALLTLAGTGIVALFILREGSITGILIAVKSENSFAGLYFVKQFNILGALIAIYGLVATAEEEIQGRRLKRMSGKAILLFGGLILLNFATLYTWGYRNQIAFLSAIFLLAYHIFIRRLRLREAAFWGMAGFLLLHGLRYLREAMRTSVFGDSALVLDEVGFIRGLSMSMHLVEFDALMLVIRDFGTLIDSHNGQDFWNGLVSWIPRFLMPDRETYFIDGWFPRIYEPTQQSGWPVTIVGSWWLNFGVLGVFLGPTVSAGMIALFDRIYARAKSDPWQLCAAAAIGAFMFNGGFDAGTPQAIILTVVPLVILRFLLLA